MASYAIKNRDKILAGGSILNNKRVHYLSLASVVAAFAMVMLHTNGCFWSFSKERYWDTANIIESVMYFAVPVFFMISGATLMDYRKRYSTKKYFMKRIIKTVIPFIIWSLFGVAWSISEGKFTISHDLSGVKAIIDGIFQTSVIKIYWFFVPLFRIYLLIPLVSYIKEECRKKVFIPLSIFLFLMDFILCNIGLEQGIHRTEIDKMCLYMSYVLVGYLIHKYKISKRWRGILYALGIVGLMIHIVSTYTLSYEAGYVVQRWKGYANIPCVLYSVAIFVLLKQIGEKIKNEKVIKFFDFISQYTFSIYLIHWYILQYMIDVFAIDTRAIWYRVGAPFLVFIICIAITWCIRKIPILRKVLP